MKKLFIPFFLILLMSSCSTAMKPNEPVDVVRRSYWDDSYSQNGESISYSSINKTLKSYNDEEIKTNLQKSRLWSLPTIPLAIFSGWGISHGTGTDNGTLVALSGVSFITGLVFAKISQNYFYKAVKVHNQKVKSKKSLSFSPIVDREKVGGGLSLNF